MAQAVDILSTYPQGFVDTLKNSPDQGLVEWEDSVTEIEEGVLLAGKNRWGNSLEVVISEDKVAIAVIQEGEHGITTVNIFPKAVAIEQFTG